MNENKKEYTTPVAEKLEFDYANTVVASVEDEGNQNPALCNGSNPGHGCGEPHTQGDNPGHCHNDNPKKNANFGCF